MITSHQIFFIACTQITKLPECYRGTTVYQNITENVISFIYSFTHTFIPGRLTPDVS
jgi:hypothetical protein